MYRLVVPFKNMDRQRKAQAGWKRRKQRLRRDVIWTAKSKPCMDCGQTFHPVCMDFDHRPGETKIEPVSHMLSTSGSIPKMLAEIAKCDVVCANCHRMRTWLRKEATLSRAEESNL